ncbi:helix-turn-helix domain-containing protein [Algicola sagamiensis]|uniref:helix-turn-helix domain-containing protein n=1 Tax=Algicola sagamiensis TaxID=163869 RepID=UPI0003605109|nr:helix-turn-helix domain-containing protein [Algicola sagamiensis]
MKTLAILAYNQMALFEFGCAVELFALARPEFNDWYQTKVVTFDKRVMSGTGGISFSCEVVSHLDDFDIVVIPSWPIADVVVNTALQHALMRHMKQGKRLITFCSGVFLPAQLGFMDGRKITTHWRYAEEFKKRFPLCHYIENVLFIYDGKYGASAGSSACLDLGIEMIRDDYGHVVANQVARRLVLSAHRQGGQSQFIEAPVRKYPDQFSAVLDWAIEHLHQDINIDQLASKANMSRRTFDRRFRETLNFSPKEWLIAQRVLHAKRLLESTHEPIEHIAVQSGFQHAINLRHHFRKVVGISPTRYREGFQKKATTGVAAKKVEK